MKRCLLPLLSLMTITMFAACQAAQVPAMPLPPATVAASATATPAESALCFETISRGDYYDRGPGSEAGRTILITTRAEVAQLGRYFNQSILDELTSVDYDRYIVVAVLRGRFGSSGYDIIVERIARQDNQIVIYAQLWQPSPWYAVTAAESSPYHLIKVLQDGGKLAESQLAIQGRVLTPTPPAEIRAKPGEILPTARPPLIEYVSQTIELNRAFTEPGAYNGPLRAFLISSAADVSKLQGLVSKKTLDALAGLDYQQLFAVAVAGREPSDSDYTAAIQHVVWQEANLLLYLQRRTAEDRGANQTVASGYHVVQASRIKAPLDRAKLQIERKPLFPVTPTPPPCR